MRDEEDLMREARSRMNREFYAQSYAQSVNEAVAAPRAPRSPLLVATVGLPRSGKTTWAQMQGRELHGQRFSSEAEPFVWLIAKVMVRSLFRAGNPIVILDACNNTRKRRDEWKEFRVVFKVIDTPAEACLERAMDEDDRHIIPVIGRMAAESQPLGDDEARYGGLDGNNQDRG